MARMTSLKAERLLINPFIDGKRWQLFSSHDTKREAENRANTVRKVKGKARVMLLSQRAKEVTGRTKLGKYGVYHP